MNAKSKPPRGVIFGLAYALAVIGIVAGLSYLNNLGSGGRPTNAPSSPQTARPTIFPVPGSLLVLAGGVIKEYRQISTTGAVSSRMIAGPDVSTTALAPNKRFLLYVSGRRVILQDLKTMTKTIIAESKAEIVSPPAGTTLLAWSPDSAKVSYFIDFRLSVYDLSSRATRLIIAAPAAWYGTNKWYSCSYAGTWLNSSQIIFRARRNMPISIGPFAKLPATGGCLHFDPLEGDPDGSFGGEKDAIATLGRGIEIQYSKLPVKEQWLSTTDSRYQVYMMDLPGYAVQVIEDTGDARKLLDAKGMFHRFQRDSGLEQCEDQSHWGVYLVKGFLAYIGKSCQIHILDLSTMTEALGPLLPDKFHVTYNFTSQAMWIGNPLDGTFAVIYASTGAATLSLIDSRTGTETLLDTVDAAWADPYRKTFDFTGWVPDSQSD